MASYSMEFIIGLRDSTLKNLPFACAPKEDSIQPAHPRSPIKVSVVSVNLVKNQNEPSDDFDQTA